MLTCKECSAAIGSDRWNVKVHHRGAQPIQEFDFCSWEHMSEFLGKLRRAADFFYFEVSSPAPDARPAEMPKSFWRRLFRFNCEPPSIPRSATMPPPL